MMPQSLLEKKFLIYFMKMQKNKAVVRLHDGDPSIYGAIKEQIDNLEKKELDLLLFQELLHF